MQPMPSATQREFNGTDLFGSLFLSGSIYGGAKSKERNRTTAKSEERRAPWPKTEREVQRGRRDAEIDRRLGDDGDQPIKLVNSCYYCPSSQIQIDCKNKTLFIYNSW